MQLKPQQKSKSGQKRINDQIQANRVMVLAEDGPKWEMSLTAALELADSLELDLVEIGMQDGLVLTKLMDYGKYLFKQQKNLSHNRAQSKKAEMKTLKITYRMADHDMEIRKNQAIRFAQDKHPLKVMLQLRGRENQYEKIAGEKVNQFLASISDIYKVEGNVSKTGNTFAVMLYPKN